MSTAARATDPRLTLDPDLARRLGHRVVDALVERLVELPGLPVGERAGRDEMEARLREPLPEEGCDPERVLETVLHDVLVPGLRVDHPRFFAFVPSPGNPVAVLADALAAGFSVFAGAWLGSPGAAMVETVVLDWLRDVCGLPGGAQGLFVSGGSTANLTALAVALDERAGSERPRAAVYVSDETHSSVERALRVTGVRHVRVLPSDRHQQLVPGDVAAAVPADRAAGRLPACVVATAGTTGTGAVDPLEELREVCDEHGMWLHVDGAYGAAAMLSPHGRARLRGIELADSLTLDPHKWLFQPLEAGCLLVRDGAALERTFSTTAAYLRDAAGAASEVNFSDRGIQLTRQFRALKLWMSLKVYGAAAFRAAVEHGLALAEHAERRLASDPAWEVVTPARLGIVTFRARRAGASPAELDALNAGLPAAALADGFAYLSSHRVQGATALRLCTINPRTTREDVDSTIDRLAALAQGAAHA
ncbi:MAG: aminotransferase class V-fold PLP-dependent enzyme [Acidimicrobiia bacterium]|nr:aminotransferase class V-fold PLP-dependent enzyme [Acidimicrobiia bacterium]